MASEFEQTTGKKMAIFSVPGEQYKNYLPPSHAQELLENFQLLDANGYYAGKSLEDDRKLIGDEKPETWIDYVKKQKHWME